MHRESGHSPGRDDGQALPIVVIVLAAAVGALLIGVRLGERADSAARAQTAADAAALAGAAGDESDARDLAAANGGELVGFVRTGRFVEVVVGVGSATRVARAEAVFVWEPASSGG